jgi:hypothetical protein
VTNLPNGRRREPRVRLAVTFKIRWKDERGRPVYAEAKTFDLSPSGAGIIMDSVLPVGTVIDLAGKLFSFKARAVVRSCRIERLVGRYVIGVEYLDGKEIPIVHFPSPNAGSEP